MSEAARPPLTAAPGGPADGVRGGQVGGVQGAQFGDHNTQHNYYGGRQRASWPHLVGVVPPRADGFQDRQIAEVLAARMGTGRTAVPTQVLSGLGGVGKTQLAAAFARQLQADGELDLLVWVSAASREAVLSGYAQAASNLVLGPDGEEIASAATRFLAWLASSDARWLIVLDDVSSAAHLRGLWPPDRATGRTVVTTRRRDSALLSGRDLVEVGTFTEHEASRYLVHKLPLALADDTNGVVADLGLLPLALGHAAAYMIDQDLTCSDYRQRFAERHLRLAGLFPDASGLFEGDTATIATTWALSIEAADARLPLGLARPLLELSAVLDANEIPESIFTSEAAVRYVAQRSGTAESSASNVRDGLRSLHLFNLVTHRESRVRVHALVQRAVRDDLSPPQLSALVRAAADAIVAIWPAADHDADRGQIMRTNSLTVYRTLPQALFAQADGVHPVLLRVVRSLGDAALLTDAVRLARAFSEQAVRYVGPDHIDTLTLRSQLATWLGDAGELAESVPTLEQLVADAGLVLGPDHPETLDFRHNLAYQHGMAGDTARAVAEMSAVLTDRSRVLGPHHPMTLCTANEKAYWQGKAGDATGAFAELRALVPAFEQVLGPDHRDTLDARGNLAYWRGAIGDPAGAVAALEQLLADVVRALGPGHRDTSVVRNNLAHWRGKAGDLFGAAAELEELLIERIRMFGPNHRDTLATRHSLAGLRAELGDPASAAAHLEFVLADRMQTLGADHPATMDVRYSFACLQGELGDPATASEALATLALDRLGVLGPDHPDTVSTQQAAAFWQVQADDLAR